MKILFFLFTLVAMTCSVLADDTLSYGVTYLDISGDGVKDMLVKTRRQTGTAHGYDSYVVAVRDTNPDNVGEPWQDISLPHFKTSEVGGCYLSLYYFKFKPIFEIIELSRRGGADSLLNPTPITQKIYRLVYDEGLGIYEMKLVETKALQPRCDVGQIKIKGIQNKPYEE